MLGGGDACVEYRLMWLSTESKLISKMCHGIIMVPIILPALSGLSPSSLLQ